MDHNITQLVRTRIRHVFVAVLILAIGLTHQEVNGTSEGLTLPPIYANPPQLLDLSGHEIDQMEVGQQAIVKVVIVNISDNPQPFMIVVQIRNGDDVTQFLSWQTGLLDHALDMSANYTFETSWMPNEDGCGSSSGTLCSANYQIRAFVISGLPNPQVVSNLAIIEGISVKEKNEQGYSIHRLALDGEEYEIEYSLPRGDIQAISADPGLHAITIDFLRVVADTSFSVSFPKVLLDKIFPPEIVLPGEGHLNILEIFVDGIPAEPRGSRETSENLTWVILIPRDSEELEFTISLLP